MTRALVVVDCQRDFVEGGSLAVAGGQEVAYRIGNAIMQLKNNSTLFDYFVATKDFHLPEGDNGGHFALYEGGPDYVNTWPVHCVQGTEGSLFALGVAEVADLFDAIFYKGEGSPAYSGFQGMTMVFNVPGAPVRFGTFLDTWLKDRNVTGLTICGIATDYCVKATALDAIDLGYDVRVPFRLTAAVGGWKAAEDAIAEIYKKSGKDSFLIN